MTKQEAASFLGVSTRAIERYVKRGLLNIKYVPMERGHQKADFDKGELEKLKEKLTEQATTENKLTRIEPRQPKESTALMPRSMTAFAGILRELLERNKIDAADNPLQLSAKLTLSKSEAATLSGLSKNQITQAIKTGKLKAKIIGKGYRIKRAALDDYIRKL